MLTLSRKWYTYIHVHERECRESYHWASQRSFALLHTCFTDQHNASGPGVFRSEHFPSFSRRGPRSVMINAARPRTHWSPGVNSHLQAEPSGYVWRCICGNRAMSCPREEPFTFRDLTGPRDARSFKVTLLMLPFHSSLYVDTLGTPRCTPGCGGPALCLPACVRTHFQVPWAPGAPSSGLLSPSSDNLMHQATKQP